MDTYSILVVDNEMGNLNALKRTFRREYNVFSATNCEDALSIMEQNDVALIIVDYRIPDMTGVELLEKISQKYPDTIRIILTAYTDERLLIDAINMRHVHTYITKPWEPEEVRAIVREELEAYEIARASEEGIIAREELDDDLQAQRAEKKMMGEILVEHDVISASQLEVALELQKREKRHQRRKLGEILVDLRYTDEESIVSCYALQWGMPCISLSQFYSKPELTELLPSKLAYKYAIVPIDVVGRVLVVAVSEPLSERAKTEIEEKTGYKVMAACTLNRDIEAALEQCYPNHVSVQDRSGKDDR